MSTKKDLYLAGLKFYGEGKNDEAIAALEEALALDHDWTDCMQALAMAQMNAGRNEDALATSRHLCELTPEDPLAFTGLSMIYQRLGRIDEAETAQSRARMLSWKQELKTNPDAPAPQGIDVIQ